MTIGIEKDFFIDGLITKTLQALKYLGSILEQDGLSTIEIEKRLSHTKKETGILNLILWSGNIIFNTLIESVLLYGVEIWTIMSANEKKNCYQQK